MKTPEGKISGEGAIIFSKNLLSDRGNEMRVSSIVLEYKGRKVNGLILKELPTKDMPFMEKVFADIMSKWKVLREVNDQRKKWGKTCFNLPSTVRLYKDNTSYGLLMSDLSENGKQKIYDFKTFVSKPPASVHREDWHSIVQQVVRDLKIADEECIELVDGIEGLDAWIVVERPDGYYAYISDVGQLTIYNSPDDIKADPEGRYWLRRSHERVMESLERIEKAHFSS